MTRVLEIHLGMQFLRLLLLLLSTSSVRAATAAQTCVYNKDYSTVLLNPFRGFVSYGAPEKQFPTSLEYVEFAMKDLMTGPATFVFSSIETALKAASARGHHTIFRVFVDKPNAASGIPSFLLNGANSVSLTPYTANGGGSYPDYNNQRLLEACEALISELGKKFDGDIRVAAIQVGLIGFYGNWNMDPIMIGLPTRTNQLRILTAFDLAFNRTALLVSSSELEQWSVADAAPTHTTEFSIGWYDNNFGTRTYLSNVEERGPDYQDYFEPMLRRHQAETRYRNVVIAGEVSSWLQPSVFNSPETTADLEETISTTHASWLLFDHLYTRSPLPNFIIRAKIASSKMGFALSVVTASIGVQGCADQIGRSCATIRLTLGNVGNAPLPYPLNTHIHLTSNRATVSYKLDADVGAILPGRKLSLNPEPFILPLTPDPDLSDFSVRLTLESSHLLRPMNFANAGSDDGLVLFQLGKCHEPEAAAPETESPHDSLVGPGTTALVVLGGIGLWGVALAAWWRSRRGASKSSTKTRKQELGRIWGGKTQTGAVLE